MTKKILFYIILFTTYSCAVPHSGGNSASFKNLFYDIDECIISGETLWLIDGGVVTGSEKSGYLGTKKKYDDFILSVEFKPSKDVNSGIFVRCPGYEGSPMDCYEINIWDNHVNQDYRTGAIVTHGPPLAHINSLDQWNNYTIKAKGGLIEVWLNDVLTARLKDTKASDGYILLQMSGTGTIQFRNVRIMKL